MPKLLLLWIMMLGYGAPSLKATQLYTGEAYVESAAKTATLARENAIEEAQIKAFYNLLTQLGIPEEKKKILTLSSSTLLDLILDFEILEEKITPNSYKATIAYRFHPEKVQAFLESKNIVSLPLAEQTPVILIPILKKGSQAFLWEYENPWRIAWQEAHPKADSYTLIIPLGDVTDFSALTTSKALDFDTLAFKEIAKRYQAEESLIALLELETPPFEAADLATRDLYARLYKIDPISQKSESLGEVLIQNSTDSKSYSQAIELFINSLKNKPRQIRIPATSYTLEVPLQTAESYNAALEKFKTIPEITKVTLKKLSLKKAHFTILYRGTKEELLSLPLGTILNETSSF